MTYQNLLNEMTSGKIFTAEFIKKDGSRRIINARTNVTKGNKGVGLSFNPISKGLLTVLDMELSKSEKNINKAKRFVNLNTLIWVKINGQTIFVKDLI